VAQPVNGDRRQADPGRERPEPLGDPAGADRPAVLAGEDVAGVGPAGVPLQALEELALLPGRQDVGGALVDDDLAVGVVGLDVVADMKPAGGEVEV
jgi:hypothetical protein